MDIISKNMSIREIKNILIAHNMILPYMWEISLWLLFNTLETDKLEVIGYGNNVDFKAIYD